MIQEIISQIENINKSLAWVKKNKPNDYEQKFLQLVEERRKLRRLADAQQDSPAIAAYGESQVGKSYMMNCILQNNGKPFLIESGGRKYNFIEEMNPKTKNTEATGVVTRFTSFSHAPGRYSAQYPIMMRCFSVADVVMVVSDGYYLDIQDFTTYSEAEIDEMGQGIYDKYKDYPKNEYSPILADDLLDIKAYYNKHLNNAQAFLHTSFFDKVALVADKIPEQDLTDVFSILWHKRSEQTKLFGMLTCTLKKFRYAEYVYLPVEALLHDGINENTVMSVDCLNELFLERPRYFTDVYLRTGDNYEKLSGLTKSEVCAVCAEIIVKIAPEYIGNTDCYCLDGITDESVKAQLTKNGINIDILKDNDLLDFPGARSRQKKERVTMSDPKQLITVLLRGKVAYLFNKYNSLKLINVLLFCHHGTKTEVAEIPLLLKDWVMNNVGETMEKRKRTLELTGGISPLFYVGTKFNIDMEYSAENIENSINGLNGRWQQRFEKVLYNECFNAGGNLDAEGKPLFLNWRSSGEHFMNSYLLRDYKFSGPLNSKLYEGEKTEAKRMLIPKEHYENLRSTFCSSEYVKRFFANPALAWDVCTSIDNDGSLYIMENLSKVAKNISGTRDELFKDILENATRKAKSLMVDYHVSTNSEEILEKNIRKAYSVFREMDFTCNTDNYYFGHLIQALQITETASYRIIHKVMQGAEINDKVNSFKDYEIIINSCKKAAHPLEKAKDEDEKWQCIMDTYRLATQEDAREYLLNKNVDPEKLFTKEYKRKMNSYVISDAVYDKWSQTIKSVDFMNKYAGGNGFDNIAMGNLIDGLLSAAAAVSLRDKMAESIAEYVNVVNIHTASEGLLADILASKINDFVLDFGYHYLSSDEISNAREICNDKNIPAFTYIQKELPATYEEKDLTQMFNNMQTNPDAILPSFEDNYNKWIEYMFISFVAHLDYPNIDHEANNALAEILERMKI